MIHNNYKYNMIILGKESERERQKDRFWEIERETIIDSDIENRHICEIEVRLKISHLTLNNLQTPLCKYSVKSYLFTQM